MGDNQPNLSKDSYMKRRELFKNIWEASVQSERYNSEGTKTKVVKTMRLGDEDCIQIGKNKKKRIKDVKTVCNRLLLTYDRQKDKDHLHDEISAASNNSKNTSLIFTHRKKKKTAKRKKKVNKVYLAPPVDSPERATSFDVEVEDGSVTHRGTTPLRDMISPRIKRATLIQQFLNVRNTFEKTIEPQQTEEKIDIEDAHRKVVKEKQNKTQTSSSTQSSPPPHAASTSRREEGRRIPLPTYSLRKEKQKAGVGPHIISLTF